MLKVFIFYSLLLTLAYSPFATLDPIENDTLHSSTPTEVKGSKPNEASGGPYQPPSSTNYPYGDETMFNNDMLNSSSEANCAEENEFIEYRPECSEPLEGIDELYVACLKSELSLEPTDLLYTSTLGEGAVAVTIPTLQCQRCDIKKNTENTALIIECYHCFDTSDPHNKTDLPFFCSSTFLEVENYTKPIREVKRF